MSRLAAADGGIGGAERRAERQRDDLIAQAQAVVFQCGHGMRPFSAPCGDLFAQGFEAVQRVGERFVLLGKVQADEVIDRLAEEA